MEKRIIEEATLFVEGAYVQAKTRYIAAYGNAFRNIEIERRQLNRENVK